jgi:hypothetical protein
MDEAVDLLNMDPTSMSNIYKVNDILHMQWIGTWTYHHSMTTALGSQSFWGVLLDFGVTGGPQTVGLYHGHG